MVTAKEFIDDDIQDTLKILCTPNENGEYTLDDILFVMERLDSGFEYSNHYTFREARFGLVSRGKVPLNDDTVCLGMFNADVMLNPQKLIGGKVATDLTGDGTIEAIRVTEYGGLLIAVAEDR